MTDGEKMVWAAAYAVALRDVAAGYQPSLADRATYACAEADRAVAMLRFGGRGEFYAEIVGMPSPAQERSSRG